MKVALPKCRTAALLFHLLLGIGLSGCGGSGGSQNGGPPNPVATVAAISPNSSEQAGPGFTLSVVGTNFITGSQVQWNGAAVPTTWVNTMLVTAEIPASAVATAQADSVTVFNPTPGGGTSKALTFTVPCPIPAPAAASTQSKARFGAYYFDGWTGPLTNFHFQGLPLGPYQDRQPLVGWQDAGQCAVEEQLAWAHNFGIDFFVFDWYFNVQVNDPGENLNSALQITHALPDRHGMQYAILYVDSPPFDVNPANWTSAVNEWVSYMSDSAYVRINGIPVLFVLNVGGVLQDFGSDAAVATALGQLRAAAQAQGLPGVYIVGGFGVPDGTLGQNSLGAGFSIAKTDGYDAVAMYNYPFAPTPVNGMVPFSTLSQAGHWTWDQAALSSSLPFIPTAMDGWDPRPWNETESTTGDLMWYSRTPQDVATFAQDAITWAQSNPQLRPEPSPTPPLVLIEAWNEFGEGSHVLPTSGEGTSYGDAIAAMLLQ
jgi:hypothetical protein